MQKPHFAAPGALRGHYLHYGVLLAWDRGVGKPSIFDQILTFENR